MANVPAQRRIAPQISPGYTETPVVDIAALAKQISAIQRTQKSMLDVQNNQDMQLEQLSASVGSITALVYPTQADPTATSYAAYYNQNPLLYPVPATSREYTVRTGTTWVSTALPIQTTFFEESSPAIHERPEQATTTQAPVGVPIDKLLGRSGSLMFLISLSSCIVWLTGDIALIHPAASIIGLLVSPCLYLMGMAARKQLAS